MLFRSRYTQGHKIPVPYIEKFQKFNNAKELRKIDKIMQNILKYSRLTKVMTAFIYRHFFGYVFN